MKLVKAYEAQDSACIQYSLLDDKNNHHGVITLSAFTSVDGSFQQASVTVSIDDVETVVKKEIQNR